MYQRRKKEPRIVSFGFKLSESEAELLEECAEKLDITKTKVVVRGIKYVKKFDLQNEEK